MLGVKGHAHRVPDQRAEMRDECVEAHDAMAIGGTFGCLLGLHDSDSSVLATGEVRSALATSIPVSWNNSGAKASRRRHST